MNRERPASSRARRVAVLAPMRSELHPLFARLSLVRDDRREDAMFWGCAGRSEVVAAITGVGMKAGRECAVRVVDAAAPDHLVVVGIAGGIGAAIRIGDLVVPELVLNLDTGAALHPLPIGNRPQQGTLASSDELIEGPEQAARLEAQGVVAIDMETAAIAAVCEQRGCPWSVFRAVSDRADDGSTDAAVFDLLDPDGSPNLAAVARFVLKRPRRIAQLVRLARGANAAARAAAGAAASAIEQF